MTDPGLVGGATGSPAGNRALEGDSTRAINNEGRPAFEQDGHFRGCYRHSLDHTPMITLARISDQRVRLKIGRSGRSVATRPVAATGNDADISECEREAPSEKVGLRPRETIFACKKAHQAPRFDWLAGHLRTPSPPELASTTRTVR